MHDHIRYYYRVVHIYQWSYHTMLIVYPTWLPLLLSLLIMLGEGEPLPRSCDQFLTLYYSLASQVINCLDRIHQLKKHSTKPSSLFLDLIFKQVSSYTEIMWLSCDIIPSGRILQEDWTWHFTICIQGYCSWCHVMIMWSLHTGFWRISIDQYY